MAMITNAVITVPGKTPRANFLDAWRGGAIVPFIAGEGLTGAIAIWGNGGSAGGAKRADTVADPVATLGGAGGAVTGRGGNMP